MEYSGLNAKIKALRGTLFNRRQYEELCQLKSDEELMNRLVGFNDYRNITIGDTGESRRYKIEQNIYMTMSDELGRIYSFVSDYSLRRFLSSFYLHNEIRVVKILLCMIYDEREIDFSYPELMVLIGKTLKTDVHKIIRAKTPAELIESLKDTQLYDVMSKFYYDNTSMFELEMRLDLYYYMHMWRMKDRNLNGINKKIAEKIIGTMIDLTNIIWIYRLKTYYNLADNILYTYLIPNGRKLKRPQISRMVEAKNKEELISEISGGPYGSAFTSEDEIEKMYDKELIKLYSSFEVLYPNSIAVTIAYLFYKELEVKNVISLIEGVRYKMEQNEILKYLVIRV